MNTRPFCAIGMLLYITVLVGGCASGSSRYNYGNYNVEYNTTSGRVTLRAPSFAKVIERLSLLGVEGAPKHIISRQHLKELQGEEYRICNLGFAWSDSLGVIIYLYEQEEEQVSNDKSEYQRFERSVKEKCILLLRPLRPILIADNKYYSQNLRGDIDGTLLPCSIKMKPCIIMFE